MNTVCTTYVRPLTVSCDHLEVVVELVVGGQPLGQRCSSLSGDVAHLVQEDLSFPLFLYMFVCLFVCLHGDVAHLAKENLYFLLFVCLSNCARRLIFSFVCFFVAHLAKPEDLYFLLFVFKPTLLPFLALSFRYLSSLRSQQSTLARIT